jgi:hypothetical protein
MMLVMLSNSLAADISYMNPEVHSQSDERKRLERPLQRAPTQPQRRVKSALVVPIVLRREDKGCEPEVREDEVEGEEVAFVGFDEDDGDGDEGEEGVDRGLMGC